MLIKKKLSIVVFGLGYVGLPLLSILAKRKFKVLGFDTNLELINDLKRGKSRIEDVNKSDLLDLKKLKVNYTNSLKNLEKYDVYIVCVPTPLLKNKSPDNSHLNSVANILKKLDLKTLVTFFISASDISCVL